MPPKYTSDQKREMAKLTTMYEKRGLSNTAASRAETDIKRQMKASADAAKRADMKREAAAKAAEKKKR